MYFQNSIYQALMQYLPVWVPDAFAGTMAQLLRAVEENSEPEISGADNLKTIAAVDACYKSIEYGKKINISDIIFNK